MKSNETVQAMISIVVSNESRQDPLKIYGRITGQFGMGSQFVLFDKPSSNPVTVMPGQSIPLDLSKVDVPPSASALEISTNLNDLPNSQFTLRVGKPGETSEYVIHGNDGIVLRYNIVWG